MSRKRRTADRMAPAALIDLRPFLCYNMENIM